MSFKDLIISTQGDSFSITEYIAQELPFVEAFKKSTGDDLFISIDANYESIVSIEYNIYDPRGKEDLRGAHTIVKTHPEGKEYRDVLDISNNIGLNTLGLILRRNPKLIAQILKKVEVEHLPRMTKVPLVFSSHPDNHVFYFGLIFTLGILGVKNRPLDLN